LRIRPKGNSYSLADAGVVVLAGIKSWIKYDPNLSNYLLRPVVVGRDGFRWLWRPHSDDHAAWWNERERFLLPYFVVRKEGVFVDIGAHVGKYSVRLAKRCKWVYSFEPNPINREALEANVKLNGEGNVTILPYACWSTDSIRHLTLKRSGSRLYAGKVPDTIEVKTVPMDQVVSESEEVELIKIDVEGAEYPVIQGMRRTLAKWKPRLIIEVHQWGGQGEEIESFLQNYGYQVERIGADMIDYGYFIVAEPDK
jgi:FkbM family methyltransferase